MIAQGRAGLDGILLLFIYLELGAMVWIYFKTSHLPVRFLLYIAITALTRLLAIDAKAMPDQHILVITGAIVLLVMAVATISMVRFKFPEKESSLRRGSFAPRRQPVPRDTCAIHAPLTGYTGAAAIRR